MRLISNGQCAKITRKYAIPNKCIVECAPTAAKYPLPQKVANFAKRISCITYLDLCYDIPSIIGCVPII